MSNKKPYEHIQHEQNTESAHWLEIIGDSCIHPGRKANQEKNPSGSPNLALVENWKIVLAGFFSETESGAH